MQPASPVSPPLPARQKEKELRAPLKFPKTHARVSLSSETDSPLQSSPHRCPELQNRVPGSRSVECGENRNSGGEARLHWPAVVVVVVETCRRRRRSCLVRLASLSTPACLLLELHHVNHIYCLHLVSGDISINRSKVKASEHIFESSRSRSFRLAGHSSDHRLSALFFID